MPRIESNIELGARLGSSRDRRCLIEFLLIESSAAFEMISVFFLLLLLRLPLVPLVLLVLMSLRLSFRIE